MLGGSSGSGDGGALAAAAVAAHAQTTCDSSSGATGMARALKNAANNVACSVNSCACENNSNRAGGQLMSQTAGDGGISGEKKE